MRRMILASLVLFPVLANAQAISSTERQPLNSSGVLQAELRKPAGMYAEVALAAAETKPAEAAASMVSREVASHAAVRESIQARFVGDDFVDAAMRDGGTLTYGMTATPQERSQPKLLQAVEVELSQQDLAKQPAVSNVVVHAVVDEFGFPRNVEVTKSAGAVIDQKAIAAVSQYRFRPATVGNQPTWASVSIAIKLQKQ
jgi:outer membrane biosynthesis protein TonB